MLHVRAEARIKTRYQKSKPLGYGWAHEKEKWNSVVINDVAFKLSNHKVTCSSVSGTKEMKGLHPLPLKEGGFLYNVPIILLQLKGITPREIHCGSNSNSIFRNMVHLGSLLISQDQQPLVFKSPSMS
jgi:hypothetical protein